MKVIRSRSRSQEQRREMCHRATFHAFVRSRNSVTTTAVTGKSISLIQEICRQAVLAAQQAACTDLNLLVRWT